jgi:hypothetical protein
LPQASAARFQAPSLHHPALPDHLRAPVEADLPGVEVEEVAAGDGNRLLPRRFFCVTAITSLAA